MVKSLSHTVPILALISAVLMGCGERKGSDSPQPDPVETIVAHARGFTIQQNDGITTLEVNAPWPGSKRSFKYLLVPKERLATMRFAADAYDAIVGVPVEKMVLTSTTHIPALEALGELDALVGFPNTDLISSPEARKLVAQGRVKDLGVNEGVNTEIALSLEPEVVMGFGINDTNRGYETLIQAGIAVVYNGDWVEETPLGKAEWIKFFAPFFNKEKEADSIFSGIEKEYKKAKGIAKKATYKPTVLSGAMYKDIWYLPAGESWVAQFLNDANADYLWKDTKGTGSLSLSFESVFEKAQNADFWIGTSQFTSYEELDNTTSHYRKFKSYNDKKLYTFSLTKGETGGLLYYELSPSRPDVVLKDI